MPVLPYSVREGLKGFRRARFSAVASTSAMAVALVLIGVFAVVGYEASEVAGWLKQRVSEMEVFLRDVDDDVGRTVHQRIEQIPGVQEAVYISRAEAAAIFQEEFGEGAEAFFDAPFLPASVRMRVESDYANVDSLVIMQAQINGLRHVDDVVLNQPLLAKVQKNLDLVTLVGLTVGILVLLASIFLVANTIRLTVYARRLLIRTMKLVGATDSFIRRPFVVEGVVQGFLAGLLAVAILLLVYWLAQSSLPELPTEQTRLIPIVAAGLVVLGVVIGWLGSALSVRRFVRNVALH